ncbi:MAG: LysM peptidoglycan-binding domain-containing M23 family metallopeptidase, partial [Hydrogenobaculum sp.]
MKIIQKALIFCISLGLLTWQAKAYECHYYKVKKGDTIDGIALKFHVYTKSIKEANPSLMRHKFLSIGQKICIPYKPKRPRIPTMSYKVKSGDTLSVLAERFGTSVRELKELNNLHGNFLRVGETIKVPYNTKYVERYEGRKYKLYIIKYGGTLRDVSDVTGIPLRVLEKLNPDLVGKYLNKGVVVKLGKKHYEENYQANKTKPLPSQPNNLKSLTREEANSQSNLHKHISIPLPVEGQIQRTQRGINIVTACGKPVKTINSGIVVYSGDDLAAYGNMAIVDGGGIITVYAYNQKLFVKKGQMVNKGQIIGLVGTKPGTSICELHFELRSK